jgi:hypothetical protein
MKLCKQSLGSRCAMLAIRIVDQQGIRMTLGTSMGELRSDLK